MRRMNTKKRNTYHDEVQKARMSRTYYEKPEQTSVTGTDITRKNPWTTQTRTKKNFMAEKPKIVVCNDRR